MATPTESSTPPSSKKSDELQKGWEELKALHQAQGGSWTLEQAVAFAKKYPEFKFSQSPEQRAQFEAELEAFKRANPLPGEKFTSDAEQPRKASSTLPSRASLRSLLHPPMSPEQEDQVMEEAFNSTEGKP